MQKRVKLNELIPFNLFKSLLADSGQCVNEYILIKLQFPYAYIAFIDLIRPILCVLMYLYIAFIVSYTSHWWILIFLYCIFVL